MGGLAAYLPITRWTFLISCLAIAGVPPLAGFWSKDEILWKAFTTLGTGPIPGWLLYAMGLAAAACTSFYMWRSYYLTFEGPHAREEIAKKVHESPPAITGVLVILAALSVVAGAVLGFSPRLVGMKGEALLEEWLAPVTAQADPRFAMQSVGVELGLMVLSVGVAFVAWQIARRRYGANRSKRWVEEEQRLPGYTLLQSKYYIDEIYEGSIVRGVLLLRLVFADMDRWIVDGVVNGVAVAARASAWVSDAIDRYLVDGVVDLLSRAVLAAGGRLRRLQTGRVQTYVYVLLGGVVLVAVLHYFFR
jgi:NADH-quinone oxidoreductase subunit L